MSILSHKVKFNRNSKGFTLVELLVVIAIIGILATLVLLQLGVARAKSRDTKRIADVNQIRTALELFSDSNGGFPGPVGGDLTTTTNFQSVYFAAGTLPVDPTGVTTNYQYVGAGNATACAPATANKTQYHIRAELERDTTALDSDSDINSTAAGGFTGTLCGTGRDDLAAAAEVCANQLISDFECQFDLGQR